MLDGGHLAGQRRGDLDDPLQAVFGLASLRRDVRLIGGGGERSGAGPQPVGHAAGDVGLHRERAIEQEELQERPDRVEQRLPLQVLRQPRDDQVGVRGVAAEVPARLDVEPRVGLGDAQPMFEVVFVEDGAGVRRPGALQRLPIRTGFLHLDDEVRELEGVLVERSRALGRVLLREFDPCHAHLLVRGVGPVLFRQRLSNSHPPLSLIPCSTCESGWASGTYA
ncbi:MAG: hypothetical protein V3R95_00580 [Dehalococcoidia bacterium]